MLFISNCHQCGATRRLRGVKNTNSTSYTNRENDRVAQILRILKYPGKKSQAEAISLVEVYGLDPQDSVPTHHKRGLEIQTDKLLEAAWKDYHKNKLKHFIIAFAEWEQYHSRNLTPSQQWQEFKKTKEFKELCSVA